MDDAAVFNVNPASQLVVANFEDGGVSAQAFHLDDILQADAAEHALKPFVRRPGNQFVQHDEDGFQAFRRPWFFDEQIGAVGEAVERFSSVALPVSTAFFKSG